MVVDILNFLNFLTSVIITFNPIVLLFCIIAIIIYLFYEDFRKISRIINFISYLSNFSEDVKGKFSDYNTNLVFILRVVFIPFFLSLGLYVINKLSHDSFTNFIIEFFYPSVKTLESPEKEKIVLIGWVIFFIFLLFIWSMYLVLKLLYTVLKIILSPILKLLSWLKILSPILKLLFRKLKVKVRELTQNKLPKITFKKNKLKVKELIESTFVSLIIFLISISSLITAEYSRVINELHYMYIFIVLPVIVLFVLSFDKIHNLVKDFVYNLNKDIVEQKIRLPKIYIIAKNLRVEGEIVNLDLDRIEIIEKNGKKCKRYSIPWNKISDVFCVEVQKCS